MKFAASGYVTFVTVAIGLASAVSSRPVFGQDQDSESAPADELVLDEITVTARKRSESLMDVPVAITAYSAEELIHSGAQDLQDLSYTTAGLNYNKQGGQKPGRYNTAVRFRGMNTNQFAASQQLGTVLLDGIYVSAGVAGIDFSNIERVEVIKGPQSATFGRSTFGGVVNFVTKTPGFEYAGTLAADMSQYGGYDISLSHEGPLIDDKLAYRISFRTYGTDGQYESATDGGQLGQQHTQSAFGVLYAEPTPNFTAKLRLFYAQDDDGPPASEYLGSEKSAWGTGTNNAGTNCYEVRPEERAHGAVADYYCGELPEVDEDTFMGPNTSVIPVAHQMFGANTYISSRTGERGFKIDGIPTVNSPGLKRSQQRWALLMDYHFDDGFMDEYTLTSVTGYNDMRANWVRDYDLTHVRGRMGQDPQKHEDFTQEIRLTSPEEDRFHWSLGASYFDVEYVQDGNGGVSVSCGTGECGAIIEGVFVAGPLIGGNEHFPSEYGTTTGVFGTFGFDITNDLTLDAEWRYQEDKIGKAFNDGSGILYEDTFYAFLPRITLSYHATENDMLWTTYSEGDLPGFFNTDLGDLTPNELANVRETLPGVSLFNGEETLKNYELGWRQRLFDDRVSFSLVAYRMDWTNLKTRRPLAIINDEGSEQILNFQFNAGDAVLKGIELETSFILNDNLSGNVMFSVNKSKYGTLTCAFSPFKRPINPGEAFGLRDCSGNVPARYPDKSASFSLNWSDNFRDSEWDYFIRGAGQYFGKSYTEEANFAWLGKFWRFDLRAGFEREQLSIVGYARNLLDDDHYLAGARWSDFSTLSSTGFLTSQGVIVTPAEKRTFGAKVIYEF